MFGLKRDPQKKLIKGIQEGSIEEVKNAFSKGAKIGYSDDYTLSPLMMSIGNKSIFQFLVEQHPDVNEQCYKGKTALMHAAEKRDNEAVRVLLEKGADSNIEDQNGHNALHYAFEHRDQFMMKLLLENGSRISGDEDFFLINFAVIENDNQLARLLVFNGLNLNVGTANVPNQKIKQTLLCHAAAWWDSKLIEFLVTNGADVNRCDEIALTPLMYAAKEGQISAVELLLGKGARVNDNINQNTAIKLAERNGHLEIVDLLKGSGA